MSNNPPPQPPNSPEELMATVLESVLLSSLTPVVERLERIEQHINHQAQAIAQFQGETTTEMEKLKGYLSTLLQILSGETSSERQTELQQQLQELSNALQQLTGTTKSLNQFLKQLQQQYQPLLNPPPTPDPSNPDSSS